MASDEATTPKVTPKPKPKPKPDSGRAWAPGRDTEDKEARLDMHTVKQYSDPYVTIGTSAYHFHLVSELVERLQCPYADSSLRHTNLDR